MQARAQHRSVDVRVRAVVRTGPRLRTHCSRCGSPCRGIVRGSLLTRCIRNARADVALPCGTKMATDTDADASNTDARPFHARRWSHVVCMVAPRLLSAAEISPSANVL